MSITYTIKKEKDNRREPQRKGIASMRKIVVMIWLLAMLTGCQSTATKTETASALLQETGVQYTMYIGLNDQDTYQQVIPTDEAEKIVSEIALKYVDGFTMTNGTGAYKDEEDVITYENSIILTFIDVPEEALASVMDDVRAELNQHAVLLECTPMTYTFYEGNAQ
jgi:hypothetical protein